MFAIGVTDLGWHERMRLEPPTDLVNYWTPTPWRVRLPIGSRWFFMLKAPVRRIGGYGVLAAYEELTLSQAWARFGPGNGVGSVAELDARVRSYADARSRVAMAPDPLIGCVVLRACVFLPPELQVTPEAVGVTFQPQIVKYKRYAGELTLPFEAELPSPGLDFTLADPNEAEWVLRNQKKRIGQAAFRGRVLEAYGGRCTITGANCPEALEAAHIQPFVSLASNHVQNGLALRKDLHALFDTGLITITPSFEVAVSPQVHSREYAALAGAGITLPRWMGDRPSLLAMEHHRSRVFRA